jgi:predicted house-cleaning noncanonical NTP pyrophosphatase (MazG superfamily)
MSKYPKLVRDKIPEAIMQSGQTFNVRVLEDEEYIVALHEKAHEELMEVFESTTKEEKVEELADLLEVIHAMTRAAGYSVDELELIRRQKAERRGQFEDRIYLIEVKE